MKLNKFFATATPIFFIFISVSLLGYYSIQLNQLYYSNYGPFYDSMAYMNQLALIMNTSNTHGFVEAIRLSTNGSTVFFPWLEASIFGMLTEPSREIAVLVQLPLVLTQAISGYLFFKIVPRYPTYVSAIFSVVLVSFSAVFFYNGGLSDFRMDLSQTLAFGSALTFFLIARSSRQTHYWIIFGIMLGISFLFRATTPVYAILIFGGCAIIDGFIFRSNFKQWLPSYLIAIFVSLAISLWFYILNFKELYYYYFVWNYDANASLPLSQSIGHLSTLFTMHIGKPIYILIILVLIFETISILASKQTIFKKLNWDVLMGGILPVGFLVLFGAAVNPFVSMASVPGILLFGLAPFSTGATNAKFKLKYLLYGIAAIVAIALSARQGIENHTHISSPWTPMIAGVKDVTRIIILDMQSQNTNVSTFEVTYVGSLDSTVLLNSFIFDQGFVLNRDQSATKRNISVSAIRQGLANPVEWNAIPGETPADKLITLKNHSLDKSVYLILPDDTNTFIPHHPISPYAIEYKNLILNSKLLIKISDPIKISKTETVTIYRNITK